MMTWPRKSFVGAILAGSRGRVPGPARCPSRAGHRERRRLGAGRRGRAWCVRVHDVRGSLDAVRVAAAWNAPSGWEKGGNHAICGAVPGGVPGP
jgi:dihydropteroate synthase